MFIALPLNLRSSLNQIFHYIYTFINISSILNMTVVTNSNFKPFSYIQLILSKSESAFLHHFMVQMFLVTAVIVCFSQTNQIN